MIDDDLRLDAASLLNFLDANHINRLFLPFVALQMLCDIGTSENIFPKSLKEVMTAGEQLKVTPQVVSFFQQYPAPGFLISMGQLKDMLLPVLRFRVMLNNGLNCRQLVFPLITYLFI
nr:hypothetical protein [Niabella ginsengisoli]